MLIADIFIFTDTFDQHVSVLLQRLRSANADAGYVFFQTRVMYFFCSIATFISRMNQQRKHFIVKNKVQDVPLFSKWRQMIIYFPFQYRLFFADIGMYNHALIEKINNKVTEKNPETEYTIIKLKKLVTFLNIFLFQLILDVSDIFWLWLWTTTILPFRTESEFTGNYISAQCAERRTVER